MIEDTRHTTQAKHNIKTPFPHPSEADKATHEEMRKLDEQARAVLTTDDIMRLQLQELIKIRAVLEDLVQELRGNP